MTDNHLPESPDPGAAPIAPTDMNSAPTECFLLGAVKKSDRNGYVQFTPVTNPQQSYDLPEDWFIGIDAVVKIRVDPTAARASGKQAFRDGNAEHPLTFDRLKEEEPTIVIGILPSRGSVH